MSRFSASRREERMFAQELRSVAKIVGQIVNRYVSGDTITNEKLMTEALRRYSDLLGPWAEILTGKILAGVSRNNLRAWNAVSQRIGRELKTVRAQTEIGKTAKAIQTEQVTLIKSLPIEAGLRAQSLAQQATISGERASTIAEELARTGEVTESRATLIARTEIAKANASLTQARAGYVGATHYIWRTAEDGDVRESHAELSGQVFSYDNPPEIANEGAHGPGEFPNCRCFAEPIIPTDEES